MEVLHRVPLPESYGRALFEGIIIGLRILPGKDFRSYMVVECRDNTFPATQGHKNRIFENKRDSDIIKEERYRFSNVSSPRGWKARWTANSVREKGELFRGKFQGTGIRLCT